ARRCFASGPLTTPTRTRSGALSRKAKPRARARSNGNPKTQKIASVSRRNSFVRALVSSTIAGRTLSDIAQLPSGQRDKKIFQRGRMRGERNELRSRFLDCSEQLGNGFGEGVDAQLP